MGCDEAVAAALEQEDGKVVVTMLVLHRQVRDFLRAKVVRDAHQSLVYIHLDLPDSMYLDRQYERALQSSPIPPEEAFRESCPNEEFSAEAWKQAFGELWCGMPCESPAEDEGWGTV